MIKDVQSLQKFVEGVIEDSLDCIVNFDNDTIRALSYFPNPPYIISKIA